MTQFGKRLIKGLEEAVAIARGEAAPAKVYADVDVAKIRAKLKLSQSEKQTVVVRRALSR